MKDKQNEEMYKILIENVSDCLWILSINTMNLIYINDSVKRLLGITVEEAICESFENSFTKESYNLFSQITLENMAKFHKGEDSCFRIEVKQCKKDKSIIDVEISARLIFDKDKTSIILLGVSRDITHRNLFTTQMNEIMRTSREPYLLMDLNENIISVNDYYCKLSGYSREEILNLRFSELIAKDSRRIFNHALQIMMEKDYEKTEIVHLKKDGDEIPFEAILNKSNIGEKLYISAFFRDITERRKMEKQLIDKASKIYYQNRFLENLLDSIPNPIFIKNKDFRYIGCNKSFEEYIGLSKEDLMYKSVYDLSTPELAKIYEEADILLKESSDNQLYESQVVNSDGSLRNVYFSKSCYFNSHNEFDGIIGIITDITNLKNQEKKLIIAKKEAEEASRAKTEFLSNMSHELRTPLNGIIGFANLVPIHDLNEENKDSIEMIKLCGENLLKLINNILEISKIEAGKFEKKDEEISLEKLISNIEKIYSRRLKIKNLEFIVKYDTTIPKKVLGDSTIINQIVDNIIGNSEKFTEKGHVKLTVTKEKDELDEIWVCFIISDTGIGINKEKQKKLFERFEQGEHYLTKKHSGTGIGLALVNEMVLHLNGKIEVETQIGVGTKIYIHIPFKVYSNKDTEIKFKDIIQLKKDLKIIMAEDNTINQKFIRKIMKNLGCDIFIVNNGEQLINELQNRNYDLILMDVQMPVINGLDATIKLKADEKTRNIPIIGISGFAMDIDVEKAMNCGMNDYLIKPIEIDSLIDKIKKWT